MDDRIAVFLDRDGTVCEEVGYINHPERLIVYPWAAEAIARLNRAGIKTILVTNQAGVARGYFDEDFVNLIHEKLRRELGAQGAYLDAIYYCPHHPEVGSPPYRQECGCRKPKPGMLLDAARQFNLDLKRSYVVGDRYLEVLLANNVGASSILLLTGYGKGEYEYKRHTWEHQPDYVAENLLTAVNWILNRISAYRSSSVT